MSLLPRKPTTAEIAGMSLTRDQAKILVETCIFLAHILKKQQADINVLSGLSAHPLYKALPRIQDRQSEIQYQLTNLVYRVRKSTEPWLKEFDDAKEALWKKVRKCNHASDRIKMGWKNAAKRYWPLMLDTFKLLAALLARLKKELDHALFSEKTWAVVAKTAMKRLSFSSPRTSSTAVPQADSKTKMIAFTKGVRVRHTFQSEVEGGGSVQKFQEYTTTLTSDRKRTAGRFKSRIIHCRYGRQGLEEQEDRKEDNDSHVEVVMREGRDPVPLLFSGAGRYHM
ncbi:uncharacterized protein K460DRAFT_288867 [Cucurbitaria berberidis CBS 394.84]|uniref:Uncharacterized protein n=1 Tax=Cucurbitaria berberidis CBS 394.84 TaxID=1168544 RepID=A0A9P4L692_9PLEO|nr:uncharacterized protein K460DRAFT_288867 [Cucurbitaria berberidis CBS 394.84]KAF1842828.1 hypothetical protein K460DRAFT_288867 [Cucurbitaria berberidis CBS 394.84]